MNMPLVFVCVWTFEEGEELVAMCINWGDGVVQECAYYAGVGIFKSF
jgi:hypothetical protein